MPTVAFRGAGAVAKSAGSTVASLAIPATATVGDLLIGVTVQEDSSISLNPPAGWVTLDQGGIGTRNHYTQICYRQMQVEDTGPWQFNVPNSTENMGVIVAYSDARGSPGNYVQSTTNASSVNARCWPITIQSANNIAIAFASNAYGTTWTAPTGAQNYSERVDDRVAASASSISFQVSDYVWPQGSTGTQVAVAANADYWKTWHIEIVGTIQGGAPPVVVSLPPMGRILAGVGL